MKTHTTLGKEAIEHAEVELGKTVGFLCCAKEVADSHHERWDGSGYPQGLTCDSIPISARIMAVADVYDALISRRVYKEAMSHEAAVEIVLSGRGSHFDSDITDAFATVADELKSIAKQFGDRTSSEATLNT
jgi:putative two-component system response regulator